FSPITGADGAPLADIGMASAFAEDRNGNIWAVTTHGSFAGTEAAGGDVTPSRQQHLLRIKGRSVVEDTSVSTIVGRARMLATDQRVGVWIAGTYGEFARVRNGTADVVLRLEAPEGPVMGYSLAIDSSGSVWFATNRGLYRWQHGRLSRLDSGSGLPCSTIY